MARIGVDLGGTKIEVIVLGEEGREIFRKRTPSPRHDYAATLATIAGLVDEARAAAGDPDATVGVGTPGSISPRTGLIRNANSTWLNERPLRDDISAAIGAPVRTANDADCFALSEAADGAGAGASSVFGIILGTGVGGGLVVDGGLLRGANGAAGEWGHMPLPAPRGDETPGPACWCGRRGCVEAWLSGPALAADYARVEGAEEGVRAETIVARAAAGDAGAEAALGRHVDRLGRALAVVANIFDPEVVVLGGGISNLPGLAEAALEAMKPHVFTDHVATRIARNVHGDSSGVRGAARLWAEGERCAS